MMEQSMTTKFFMNASKSYQTILDIGQTKWRSGELNSRGVGKKSIHHNGSDQNIEFFLRTVISLNQFSIFGAVADMCNELSEDLKVVEKHKAPDYLDNMDILTGLSIADIQANEQHQWNLHAKKNTSKDSVNCPKTRSYPNLCCEVGLRFSWDWTKLLFLLRHQEEGRMAISMSRIHEASRWRRNLCETVDSW